MSVVDKNGRLFGSFNLVDAGVVLFIALLIPIGYATFLLFRPERPAIESVTRVELTNEERRVSSGMPRSRGPRIAGVPPAGSAKPSSR